MGINSRVFDLIATHCRREEPGRALIAGYPDMLVDEATYRKHCGSAPISEDKAAAAIQKRHAWGGLVADPHTAFAHQGYKLTIIDIAAEHGEEQIVDLNQTSYRYEVLRQKYDLVLDHGTIEHCFNIGQAALNLVGAVAEGGWMVQHLPFSMANHGFYNVNPTWFYDLAEANGLEVIHFEGFRRGEPIEMPRYGRFVGPEEALCTMVARRVKDMPPTMPMQHIYRRA